MKNGSHVLGRFSGPKQAEKGHFWSILGILAYLGPPPPDKIGPKTMAPLFLIFLDLFFGQKKGFKICENMGRYPPPIDPELAAPPGLGVSCPPPDSPCS